MTYVVYGWYSDNSVFLEDYGIYLRAAFNRDPVFIRTWTSETQRSIETWRLFGTWHLIEV